MDQNKLIKHAKIAQSRAKAPFSKYPVGAVLLTENSDIILGCNVESKAYPNTLCAERVAIFSAIAQGYSKFKSMTIITNDGAKPCGGCRQTIYEYARNIKIYIMNQDGIIKEFQSSELLPFPFD